MLKYKPMKKTYLFFAFMISFLNVFSQACTPDNSHLGNPGFSPDTIQNLSDGFVGLPYSEVITVVIPQDTTAFFPGIGVATLTINYMQLDSIGGLPPGFSYACNPSNCQFPGNSIGCIVITGNPQTFENYPLRLYLTYNLTHALLGTFDSSGPYTGYEIDLICNLVLVSNQPTNYNGNVGGNAVFSVSTNETGVSYQWQTDIGFGFQNVTNAGQYSGSNTNTLTVSTLTLSNNNQFFRCILSKDNCPDTSNIVTLTVNNVTGVYDKIQNLFSISPNPALTQLTLNTSNLNKTDYAIYDVTGRIMSTGSFKQTATISISDFAEGNYFIQLTTNQTTATKKFIKQ